MNKYTYKRILAVFLMAVMVFSLGGCGNKLEKDLKEAKKIVERSEEQEDKWTWFLETVMGLDPEEYDISSLENLADMEDLTSLTQEDTNEEDAQEDKIKEDEDADSKDKNDEKDDSSSKKKKASDFNDYMSGEYAGLMASGKYYMEYTSYIWGMEGSGKTAVDGTNNSTVSEMMGYTTWTLILDGYQYEIDIAQEKYTKTEVVDAQALQESMQMNYTGLEYVRSGYGEIPGMEDVTDFESGSYDYDEYKIAVDMDLDGSGGSQMDVFVRLFMDGNNLYAISSSVMGIDTVMIIDTLSDDIPDEMFELPDGYEEVDSLY